MIFALADYIQYQLMKKKYSICNLKRNHAMICSKENIHKYFYGRLKNDEIGSIFLHTRKSFLSWLIMYYTNGVWSHCAILLPSGEICESILTKGLTMTSPDEYIDEKSYFSLFIIKVPDMGGIKKEIENLNGSKYDWVTPIIIFIKIILGLRSEWKLKYSLDIYCLLLLMYFLNIMTPLILRNVFIIYTTILMFNILKCKIFDMFIIGKYKDEIDIKKEDNFIEKYYSSINQLKARFFNKKDCFFEFKEKDAKFMFFLLAPYLLFFLPLGAYGYIFLMLWSILCIMIFMIMSYFQNIQIAPISNPFESEYVQIKMIMYILLCFTFANYSLYLFDSAQFCVINNAALNIIDMLYFTITTAVTLGDKNIIAQGWESKLLVICEIFCFFFFILNVIPIHLIKQVERVNKKLWDKRNKT